MSERVASRCWLLLALAGASGSGACTPAHARSLAVEPLLSQHGITLASRHRQLLLVSAPSWRSSHAVLRRFWLPAGQRRWQPAGPPIQVRIGKQGLGRGRGLKVPRGGPAKQEGDRRSPAGVFALGEAFGTLRPSPAQRGRWPWRSVDRRDRWVDDPESPLYNTWQRVADGAVARWRSAETLAHYPLAIVIAHNTAPVVKGAGSAIFLHSGDLRQGSIGCTVLARGDLLRVLRWLRPAARPVIVQLPEQR